MKKKTETKKRILIAAQKEFSLNGFSGARMDQIAARADVNKAMLFYYFSSKESLYKTVLANVFKTMFSGMKKILRPNMSAKVFLEKFPEYYIRFVLENEEYVRIFVYDLLRNPEQIKKFVSEIIQSLLIPFPKMVIGKIKKWHEKGEIVEGDPFHLIMNIVALSVFSSAGRPMVEAFSGISITDKEEYIQKRIQCVTDLLKRGLLT